MKFLIMCAVLFGSLNIVFAGNSPEFFPSGPSNLFPGDDSERSLLWVGGGVAQGLFNGMDNVTELTSGSTITRFGEDVDCHYDSSIKGLEYSCALMIESSTGEVVR